MRLIKSKKVTRFAFAGALLMTLFTACEYDYILTPPPPPITEEIKFSTNIIPIFNESCNMSGCHTTGGWEPDLTAENAFAALQTSIDGVALVDTTNPSASLIYTTMATGKMKSYSTPQQAAEVLAWITQGAKNN